VKSSEAQGNSLWLHLKSVAMAHLNDLFRLLYTLSIIK